MIALPFSCITLFLPEKFLLPEEFCDVLAFTELGDYVKVVFGLEDVEEFEQVLRVSHFDGFKDIDFLIDELFAELILFAKVDHLYGNYFVWIMKMVLFRSFLPR